MYVKILNGGLLGIRVNGQWIRGEQKGKDETIFEKKFKWDGNNFIDFGDSKLEVEIKAAKENEMKQ